MNAPQKKPEHIINVPAKPGVYRITNSLNGKVYIGMSVNMLARSHDHRNDYKNKFADTKLKKAFRKYGKDSFIFDALFVAFDDCDLVFIALIEEQLIAEYDSVRCGYNMLPASRGIGAYGVERSAQVRKRFESPEERMKCSLPGEKNPMFGRSRKGELVGGAVTPMFGEKNAMYGRPWYTGRSEDEVAKWKANVSKATAGKNNPMFGSTFLWITNGIDVIRHDKSSSIPSGWYAGFPAEKRKAMIAARRRKVRCIDTGTVYESLTAAAEDTNSLVEKITMCCRGQRKRTNGLRWEYVEDGEVRK